MSALNIVSNLTNFMAEPVQFMRELAILGEMQRLRIGPKRFIFFFNPEAAQEILIKRADIYVQNRAIFDRIQPITGEKGLVQLSGEKSQSARAKSRSMFTAESLDAARSITEFYCDALIQRIGSNGTMEVTEVMTALILRTALKIFLGIDSEEVVSQIGKKFLRLNHLCGLRMRSLMPPPLYIPTFKNREIKRLQSEIRAIVEKEVSPGKNAGVPKALGDDCDLIDHCMTFLFAGHETTASSLAFTLLLLAQNPKHQEAIAAGDEAMTLAAYKESLRLFPPAYMLAREAAMDDQLCGQSIKKSDQIIIGIAELHRNPRFFERPNDFFPERFQKKLKHQFSFIPFGAGAKSCVGKRVAYLEASIVLKKICRKFRLSTSSELIRAEPLITLHPLANQTIRLLPREGKNHG